MVLRHLADSDLKDDQLAGVDGGAVEHSVEGRVIDAWVAVVVQSPCFVVPAASLTFIEIVLWIRRGFYKHTCVYINYQIG